MGRRDPGQDTLLWAIDTLGFNHIAKLAFFDIAHISTSSYFLDLYGLMGEANVTLTTAGEDPDQLFGTVGPRSQLQQPCSELVVATHHLPGCCFQASRIRVRLSVPVAPVDLLTHAHLTHIAPSHHHETLGQQHVHSSFLRRGSGGSCMPGLEGHCSQRLSSVAEHCCFDRVHSFGSIQWARCMYSRTSDLQRDFYPERWGPVVRLGLPVTLIH